MFGDRQYNDSKVSHNHKRRIDSINSSYHSSIKRIPERLEIFDEVDLIPANIAHNNRIDSAAIQKGDFVRLLNKRGAFEKEGQRFTCKIYLVEEVGINSVRVASVNEKESNQIDHRLNEPGAPRVIF